MSRNSYQFRKWSTIKTPFSRHEKKNLQSDLNRCAEHLKSYLAKTQTLTNLSPYGKSYIRTKYSTKTHNL